MNKIFTLIALLLLLSQALSSAKYDRVDLTNSRALCLDGSQAVYYLSIGDPKKVLMFL